MDTTFGRRIKKLRNRKGWSVYKLAKAIGKSPGYVSKIEARGEIPSPEMISALAVALNAEAKELFELAKREKSEQLTQTVEKRYNEGLELYRKAKRKGERKRNA